MRLILVSGFVMACSAVGCAEDDGGDRSLPPSGGTSEEVTESPTGMPTSTVEADAAVDPLDPRDGAVSTAQPAATADVGTGDEPVDEETDPLAPLPPSGDLCTDATQRIAVCYLAAPESACTEGADAFVATVAGFLVDGGSCSTLEAQGIDHATPCDQPPMPQHVAQLAGFGPAMELCAEGPATSAELCAAACDNLAPCVDAEELDPKLRDSAICYNGCLRNEEDVDVFTCSAGRPGDCEALAECWTEPAP